VDFFCYSLQTMGSSDSIQQKIIRAAEHFQALEVELKTYFQSGPAKMVMEPNSTADELFFTVQHRVPIPVKIPLIIGDCIQNARSSLDYLVRELVLTANNQPTDHEMFPICDRPKGFKDAIRRGQLIGIPAEATTIIESLQPYKLGKDWEKASLWVLNEFANVNKHRRLLVTVLRGGTGNFEFTKLGNDIWARGRFPAFQENTKIGPFIPSQSKMQMKGQIVACITFDEGAAKGIEICTCLNAMLAEMFSNVLPRFEQFFA
jgi:hypothetical protein